MTVFLDACVLIYRFEGHPKFKQSADDLIAHLTQDQTAPALAVSRLTLLECRVKPLRERNQVLLQRYDDFFRAVRVQELSAAVVGMATEIRARYGLKTPDALQAASALTLEQPVVFVTGDQVFERVPGLDVRLIGTRVTR